MTDLEIVLDEECQYQDCDRLASRRVEFCIKGSLYHAVLCDEHAEELDSIDLLEFHGKWPAQKGPIPVA